MERPTLRAVAAVVNCLARETIVACPKTKNKGAVGILCETLSGVPQSSAHLDCVDGEVKVFPLKRNRDGSLSPKETIAVTMMNAKTLAAQDDFVTSTCGSKLSRVLYVPYLRENDTHVRFFPPSEIHLTAEITSVLKKDYDDIRARFLDEAVMTSGVGVFLQTRTKGAGGDAPKTRAFYLKKEFINRFITQTW